MLIQVNETLKKISVKVTLVQYEKVICFIVLSAIHCYSSLTQNEKDIHPKNIIKSLTMHQ